MTPSISLRRATLLAAVLSCVALASDAEARGGLETAVFDPYALDSGAGRMFGRVAAAGAGSVRLNLVWSSVAPKARPPSFEPRDPDDPAYRWDGFDAQVAAALEHGLTPIVTIVGAPTWAEGKGSGPAGMVRPSPRELGHFARAAAERYSGRDGSRPRIRRWQVWNEPNISLFLVPQFVDGRPFSPGWYRRMVNEVAAAVKSVHASNLVIAGGTAPFRDITPEVQKVDPRWGPLSFMREFLCLSKSLQRKCKQRARFDVWAHHPYTSGGPTRNAVLPDDVSLGDLPEMRRVLNAGVRARNVVSRGPVKFWVTEFSWDSKKPDPRGVPTSLHTRWVAEAMYRMWHSGVSLVTWFLLRDQPLTTSFYQSGLYYRGASTERDRPKPALRAFRFPVVAIPDHRGVLVWGRTPAGARGSVVVEQSFKGGWRRLGVVAANRHGIFQRRFAIRHVGAVRARLVRGGEKSVPFRVKPVADRFFNPFGQTTLLEPKRR